MIPFLIAELRRRSEVLYRALLPKEEAGRDDGLGTLEYAIIALGVLGLAIALVAAITSAVNSRLEGIQ
ncbi:DUF4244 domain-containing protein [Nocardiopsis sp. NPDC006139]|uniref:DUF4244 domain-containing protein n=1 Tax=Nocardiopsis sp. NPDC006139 TaxID=3154578 RepID=UPI0033B77989